MYLCRHSIVSVPFLQGADEFHGHTGPAVTQGGFKILEGDRTNLLEDKPSKLLMLILVNASSRNPITVTLNVRDCQKSTEVAIY